MMTATVNSVDAKFYWNRLYIGSGVDTTIDFDSDDCSADYCSKAKNGGRGFLAMQIFAFIGLTITIFFTLVRILGISISSLEPTRKVLFGELVLTALNTFLFFLSVCIYGGTTFHEVGSTEGYSVTGTGFGFTICCFFFLIFGTVIIYIIRGDSSTHLGSSASGSDYTNESDPNTTSYNPPASYQYDNNAAYAGSYNGDVMPATQQASDNNL